MKQSIRQEMMVVTLFFTILGPAICVVAFYCHDFMQAKREVMAKAEAITRDTGKKVAAALKANDVNATRSILASLGSQPMVRKACVQDSHGERLAAYFQNNVDNDCNYMRAGKFFLLHGGFMDMVYPIHADGGVRGHLSIRYGLLEMISYLKSNAFAGIIIFFVTALLVMLTALPFQNFIMAGIGRTVNAVEKIAREKDYFSRVESDGPDEMQSIGNSVNMLLETIRQHDIIMTRENRLKEDRVVALTRDLRNARAKAEKEKQALQTKIESARQLVEQAQSANRYKSQFLANMSHEIRTPLNAILGFAQILEDRVTGETEQQYLKSIAAGGNTLLTLINEILDLSKIEAGKLELNYYRVDVTRLLNNIQRLFSKQIKDKNLQFFLEIDSFLPPGLWLDGARLRQILINLVGNAIKFTDQGYIRIRVQSRAESVNDDKLDLVISVEDTGMGVAEGQQEAIFEAFQQQRDQQRSYKGSGLGLAISKRLADMMNGQLTVESQQEKGAVFTLELKNVSTSPAPEGGVDEGKNNAASAYRFKHAKILVVDDVRINRVLISEFLKGFDFKLLEAENGRSALRLARAHHPDIILMDMVMPEMDGYEATRFLKSDPDLLKIPVIAVTASVLEERRTQIFAAGCNGFIKKPVQKEEILSELARFLPMTGTSDTDGETVAQILDQSASEALPAHALAKLPDLLRQLRETMMPRFEQLTETMLVAEIETFGLKVAHLGEDNEITLLKKWGRLLSAEAERFDVDGMTDTLKSFPLLLDRIASFLEHNHGQ